MKLKRIEYFAHASLVLTKYSWSTVGVICGTNRNEVLYGHINLFFFQRRLSTILAYVTGFVKTVPNRTFSISRNTVLKYSNNCVSLVLHYSRARLAI